MTTTNKIWQLALIVSLFAISHANNREYVFINSAVPFATAEADCVARGSHLATVQDDADIQALADAMAAVLGTDTGLRDITIGLTDQDSYGTSEGNWVWVDGTPCENKFEDIDTTGADFALGRTDGYLGTGMRSYEERNCFNYWGTSEPNQSGEEDCPWFSIKRDEATPYWRWTNDGHCSGAPGGGYACNIVNTAVDCIEGTQFDDSPCSVVCGGGTLTTTRSGDTPAENGGAECSDPIETGVECNTQPCPIDCVVGAWYDVSDCSKYCGEGEQFEERVITTEPQFGGQDCAAVDAEYGGALARTVTCNEHDCCPNEIGTFNWDEMSGGADVVPDWFVAEFEVYPSDLTLHINVELEYLGKTSAHNQREAKFGTTYVLDFDDFDAHSDNIREPGTCQNRKESSFDGELFNDIWTYSEEPQNAGGVGSDDTLAYPGSDWTVSMKDEQTANGCDTVVYERTFTWQELRECSAYGTNGERLNSVVKEGNDLKLSGIFYINVVSPFAFNSDFGYYRVYQLLSQPFVITVSSSVSVLATTGINLFTMWVIAVYKENRELSPAFQQDFRLVIMTESAEYLTLARGTANNEIFEITNANNIDESIFTVSDTPEGACLANPTYICTQLWNIDAFNPGCTEGGIGTDFSGTYHLGFTPQCNAGDDETHCREFLAKHGMTDGILLSADLVWKDEICDPKTWDLQFIANMLFYTDSQFADGATIESESHLYQAGVDTIYVEIETEFPDATLTVFNTVLTNVWICTFPPGTTVYTFDDVDNVNVYLSDMGCLSAEKDASLADIVDGIFPETTENIAEFQTYAESEEDIIQFSFLIPEEVTRDTLYIHAQIEVELIEGPDTTTRRRVLLGIDTANQISHFGTEVGIGHGPNNKKKPIPNAPINNPTNPNPSVYLSLKESWVIAIACVLAAILAANVAFMCYTNRHCLFKRRRGGYASVKPIDSEFDSEAPMIDNQ